MNKKYNLLIYFKYYSITIKTQLVRSLYVTMLEIIIIWMI